MCVCGACASVKVCRGVQVEDEVNVNYIKDQIHKFNYVFEYLYNTSYMYHGFILVKYGSFFFKHFIKKKTQQ